MPKFSEEKHDQFDAELGELVTRYVAMSDVDALSLHIRLMRRAEEMKFIGIAERQAFRDNGNKRV